MPSAGCQVVPGARRSARTCHNATLLVDFVEASGLRVYECAQLPDLRRAVALMSKYADTPMDFADATLIGLAERLNTLDIVTLDRHGFSTYRTSRGKSLRRVLDQT